MKINWKWNIGLALALIVLYAFPLAWRVFTPYSGYGMMRGYGYGMPMMRYGFGMLPFGMWFMWLIPVGILTLIVLGIVWLIKQIMSKA